jgi:hypothetical protein
MRSWAHLAELGADLVGDQGTASRSQSPCSPAITLATSSAAVVLWPSAIGVSPLIGSLLEPTSLTPRGRDLHPALRGARYATSTDVTGRAAIARDAGCDHPPAEGSTFGSELQYFLGPTGASSESRHGQPGCG